MLTLADIWLNDQIIAFCAANLAGNEGITEVDFYEQEHLAHLTQCIGQRWTINAELIHSDTTLALLTSIPDMYDVATSPSFHRLEGVRNAATIGVARRAKETTDVSAQLIRHAVYIVKRHELDFYRLIKWFTRNTAKDLAGAARLLSILNDPLKGRVARERFDQYLDRLRDRSTHTRDRVRAVDEIWLYMSSLAGNVEPWITRLCLSLRSALYCWPLMIGGAGGEGHGISLPISVFLPYRGVSRLVFRDILAAHATGQERRVTPATRSSFGCIEGSSLHWDWDWGNAIRIGAVTAKSLWKSQNGRLNFVDPGTAEAYLNTDVHVDMNVACKIVDAVYGSGSHGRYVLEGRSAEAYWAQVVLGLLLPGREIPFGAVTGRIEKEGGLHVLRHVIGVGKKLEYANNAGFPRLVLPGMEKDDERGGLDVGSQEEAAICVAGLVRAAELRERVLEAQAIEEINEFRMKLAEGKIPRRVELNYCETVRAAADAMQPSGWRRAVFMRMPDAQREFSYVLRRLFLKGQLDNGRVLSKDDQRYYRYNEWIDANDRLMRRFDGWLMSKSRTIKFIERAAFDEATGGRSETVLGQWTAWKDHQIRMGTANGLGARGPGLGILCLRTAASDNDLRLWLAIGDALAANSVWMTRFQWADSNQAAGLLAELLGNRRADPAISLSSAPDMLIILDEGNLTQRRMNRIFPNDFRGNWNDLINPTQDDRGAPWPLEQALSALGDGALGQTRIIIIHGERRSENKYLPPDLSAADEDLLRRLAVFRFGFSQQAAFVLANYNASTDSRSSWNDLEVRIREFKSHGILREARGALYLTSRFARTLKEGTHWDSPAAHLAAAEALAPIIAPRRVAIASNPDRSLEPETALEARWHLGTAWRLIPRRSRGKLKTEVTEAFNNIVFLQSFPDWDTVKSLQSTNKNDAIGLARELLSEEKQVRGYAPHSSRVARFINLIGDVGISELKKKEPDADTIAALIKEAIEACIETTSNVSLLSYQERQRIKLYSEFLYAIKSLRYTAGGPILTEAEIFLRDAAITKILGDTFIRDIAEDSNLPNHFPVAEDWLKSIFEDESIDIHERAQMVTVLTRLSYWRTTSFESGDIKFIGPWMEYFALHSPIIFRPLDIRWALTAWNVLFGLDDSRLVEFAEWTLNGGTFHPRKGQKVSSFGGMFEAAIDNLWRFASHDDPIKRLPTQEGLIARKFIRSVGLAEVVPAYGFVRQRDLNWFRALADDASDPEAPPERRRFSACALKSQAAWVHLLAIVGGADADAWNLWVVRRCLKLTPEEPLAAKDPENIIRSFSGSFELAQAYQRARKKALKNGSDLLSRRADDVAPDPRLQERFRRMLAEIA